MSHTEHCQSSKKFVNWLLIEVTNNRWNGECSNSGCQDQNSHHKISPCHSKQPQGTKGYCADVKCLWATKYGHWSIFTIFQSHYPNSKLNLQGFDPAMEKNQSPKTYTFQVGYAVLWTRNLPCDTLVNNFFSFKLLQIVMIKAYHPGLFWPTLKESPIWN